MFLRAISSTSPISPVRRIALPAVVLALCLAVLATVAATTARALEIQQVRSQKGITAWLVEDHTVPVIAMNYAFKGGGAADPQGKYGLASFLSAMLDEGAGEMDSQAFQARMEELAFSMSHSAGQDWFSGSFKTLSRNRDESFRMLALALNRPRFDAKPLERIRKQLIVALRSEMQDPDHLAWLGFKRALFGDHPYARDPSGREEDLKRITAEDLRGLHRRLFARSGLIVTVAGDIDAETLAKVLDEVFGDLPRTSGMPQTPKPAISAAGTRQVIDRAMPQTIIYTGHEGLLRSDPDFIPAYVVNHILGGGGFGSRLNEVVREKNGLAYSVYSALFAYDRAGVFFAYASTRNEQAMRALKLMRAEIQRMAREGPTEKELEEARRYLIGSWPLRFDSNARIASMLLAIRRDGLGIDYLKKRNELIRAVTIQEARRVAKRLLKPGALKTVLLGRPAPGDAEGADKARGKAQGATPGKAHSAPRPRTSAPAMAR